jgi:small ligand-binding sensory domain FIST
VSQRFAAACVSGPPEGLARQALAALAPVAGATLGILYVSEPAAPALAGIAESLAAATGIPAWVGGVGLGILGTGAEIHDAPAAAILVAALAPESFRVFAASADPGTDLQRLH